MPTVICSQGHITHWRSRRGSNRPQTCPQCGAICDVADYDAEGNAWKPQPKKRRAQCAECGRGMMVVTADAEPLCRRCMALAEVS